MKQKVILVKIKLWLREIKGLFDKIEVFVFHYLANLDHIKYRYLTRSNIGNLIKVADIPSYKKNFQIVTKSMFCKFKLIFLLYCTYVINLNRNISFNLNELNNQKHHNEEELDHLPIKTATERPATL